MEIRVRLRPWLETRLNEGWIDGLKWLDKEKGVFRIPWKHHSKHTWTESDAAIFKDWAVVTGRYRVGIDEPDWPMWKTRLRCALNKAPDIQEVKQRHNLHCEEPFKVYRFISKTEALWRSNATRHASMIFDGISPMQKIGPSGLSLTPYRLCQIPQPTTVGKRPAVVIQRLPGGEMSRPIALIRRREDGVLVKYIPGASNPSYLPAAQHSNYNEIPQDCTGTFHGVSEVHEPTVNFESSVPSSSFHCFRSNNMPSSTIARCIGSPPVVSHRVLPYSLVPVNTSVPMMPDLLEPEPHQLGIRIQHLNMRVRDAIITNPNGCCIYFGRYDEINSLAAPDPMEAQIPHHVSEANKEYVDLLLDNMVRGIILSVNHGNIYAERMCKCAVFVYVPTSDGDHMLFKKLGRKVREKIFDFCEFLRDLRLNRVGQGPKPHFEVVLAFGQQLRPGISTDSLLVWSRIASCRAWFHLQKGCVLPMGGNAGDYEQDFFHHDEIHRIHSVNNQSVFNCGRLDSDLIDKRSDDYLGDDEIPTSLGADMNGYHISIEDSDPITKPRVLHSLASVQDIVSTIDVTDGICEDDTKTEQIIEECVEVPLDDSVDLVYDTVDASVIHRSHLIGGDSLHVMNGQDVCASDPSDDIFLNS